MEQATAQAFQACKAFSASVPGLLIVKPPAARTQVHLTVHPELQVTSASELQRWSPQRGSGFDRGSSDQPFPRLDVHLLLQPNSFVKHKAVGAVCLKQLNSFSCCMHVITLIIQCESAKGLTEPWRMQLAPRPASS